MVITTLYWDLEMLLQKPLGNAPELKANTALRISEPPIEFSSFETRVGRKEFLDPPTIANFRVLESPRGLNPGKIEISEGASSAVLASQISKGVPEIMEDAFQSIGDTMARVLAEKITGRRDFNLPQSGTPTKGIESTIVDLTRKLLSTQAA